jgi:hypothetical protein
VEPLREAWATFDFMFTLVIQLLYYRLFTRFLIYLVILVEIWFDCLHIRMHVKRDIVSLLVHNKMCTSSPNTFTLLLKNL